MDEHRKRRILGELSDNGKSFLAYLGGNVSSHKDWIELSHVDEIILARSQADERFNRKYAKSLENEH